jgi:hypothetical protein
VVPSQLDKALVQRVSDQIMIMRTRLKDAVDKGFYLEWTAHASEREIA